MLFVRLFAGNLHTLCRAVHNNERITINLHSLSFGWPKRDMKIIILTKCRIGSPTTSIRIYTIRRRRKKQIKNQKRYFLSIFFAFVETGVWCVFAQRPVILRRATNAFVCARSANAYANHLQIKKKCEWRLFSYDWPCHWTHLIELNFVVRAYTLCRKVIATRTANAVHWPRLNGVVVDNIMRLVSMHWDLYGLCHGHTRFSIEFKWTQCPQKLKALDCVLNDWTWTRQ